MSTIQRAHSITLFAPSNDAWDDNNLRNLLVDKSRIRDILNMHLVVDDRLYLDTIVENNKKQVLFVIYNFAENVPIWDIMNYQLNLIKGHWGKTFTNLCWIIYEWPV